MEEYVYDDNLVTPSEPNDDVENGSPDDKNDKISPLKVLFKTMFTPVEGWKALRRAKFTEEKFASDCFYPLVGLAAISEASMFIYEANVTPTQFVVKAAITFVTFFFGYFGVILCGGFMLPKGARFLLKSGVGKEMVMLALSSLALFLTVINLLPMLEPVLVFLPLWTIYIVIKGVRQMRVPSDCVNSTSGLLCMLLIGVPLFWHWLLTEFMPV